jgi:hypothetical protein
MVLILFVAAIPSLSQNSILHSKVETLTDYSVNNTERPAILPLKQPHGAHMQDLRLSSSLPPCRVSPNCSISRRLCLLLSFNHVDLSPRVRGSTQVGPTISAIWA